QLAQVRERLKTSGPTLAPLERSEDIGHSRHGQDESQECADAERGEAEEITAAHTRASFEFLTEVTSIEPRSAVPVVGLFVFWPNVSSTALSTRTTVSDIGPVKVAPAASRWPPPPNRAASCEQSMPPRARIDTFTAPPACSINSMPSSTSRKLTVK